MTPKTLGLKPLFVFGMLASFAIMSVAGCATSYDKAKEQAVETMIKETMPSERAAVLTDLMSDKLQLNESQKTQVADLNIDYSTRFSILMESTNPNVDKRAEFLRLSAEKEVKLKSILTDIQIQAYDANKAELLDTYRIM